ncbi:MAG: 5-Nucleotidase domain protein [Acidobacteria bacterium]|nr:5-Nucleotidase domain protein [Acidobacteriota bacterium]
MSKTNKFQFSAHLTRLCLVACLLAISLSAVVAQQSTGAKPAQAPAHADVRARTSQTVVDSSLPDDPAINKMLGPYAVKVRALDVVIGKLEGELKKGGLGGGTLGNFVTDGMRAQAGKKLGAPIDLVISNSGGLRKNVISPGDLHIRDIFELLPFENALVELELTGTQLRRVLEIAVENREPQSGARVKYRTNAEKKLELASVVLVSVDGKERQIDPQAVYRVITIDYLLNVEGGKFAILHEARVKKPLGVTIRDALIEYVKDEAAAGRSIVAKFDGRFRREGTGPAEEPQ